MQENQNLLPENDTIEKLFNFYLKKVQLESIDKNGIQYQEVKRAFFGTCGIMAVFIGELSDLSEEEFDKKMDGLKEEIQLFWAEENKLAKKDPNGN